MAYCDLSDVQLACGGEDDLIELSDQNRDGALDGDVIDKAIARADALINTYAKKLFQIPIDPVTDELRERSSELAAYYLRKWKHALTDDDRKDFEEHIKWLTALSKGEVTLDAATLPTKSPLVVDKTLANISTNGRARDGKKGYW